MAILISLILVFGALSLLALIHICFVGRSLRRYDTTIDDDHRRNRGGPSPVRAHGAGTAGGMSKEEIEKLPSYDHVVKRKELNISSSTSVDCAVCLDNFKGGEKCRLLPNCKHSFHVECVDEWLSKNPICPICRTSAVDSRKPNKLLDKTRVDSRRTESSSSSSNSGGFSEASIELRDVRIDHLPAVGVDSAT